MKRRVLTAAIVATFFVGCGASPIRANSVPLRKNEFGKRSLGPEGLRIAAGLETTREKKEPKSKKDMVTCKVDDNHLVYTYYKKGKPRQIIRLLFSLGEGEKAIQSECWESSTPILTNKALYLYPSSSDMKEGSNADFDYTRIGLDSVEDGALSKTKPIFLVRSGNRVEAYHATPTGIENLISYDVNIPIIRIRLDDSRERIVIECKGAIFEFDYSGKQTK